MVAVCVARLLVTMADPDLVHPIDPAELGHLKVLPALMDGRLSGLLDADANIHHGGFFWLGVPVGVLRMLVGSDLLAVRGMAAVLAALTWGIWVVVAHRLGGRVAALGLGICLAMPSPWMAQWTATLWGSHAEAGLWTGLWTLALVCGWRASVLGALLGVGVAWDPLLWPTALLAWVVSSHRSAVLRGLVPAWLILRAPTLFVDPVAVVSTSLSEHAEHTIVGVLGGLTSGPMLWATLATHLPLPWTSEVGRAFLPVPLDGMATVVSLVASVWVVRTWRQEARAAGPGRAIRLLAWAPWVHLGVVLLFSPTRPQLAHRYLVAWWPALLLLPWLLSGRRRVLAAAPVLASMMALPVWVQAVSKAQPDILWRYPAERFQAVGLDRVPAARSPAVVAFLDRHADPVSAGFAAAFSPRWGYPVWGERFGEQVRAAGLASRLEEARRTDSAAQVDADFGHGLVVVCDRVPSCVQGGLEGLAMAGVDTSGVARGVAEALGGPAR